MKFYSWFQVNLEINFDFKSTLKSTLISSQPWNQLWFQVNLEIIFDFKKTVLAYFGDNLDFKETWIFHWWIIIHNVSLVSSEEDVNIISRMILTSRHRVVGRVLIVCVKIFKYQCCIFSQKCCGVPWFVFLTKLCLCKWGVISLISHAFQLMVFDVELSIWEDEDVTFNIPWTRCFPVNCQLNFFFIHQSQSASVKIIVSFTPEIDKKSESVSSLKSVAFIALFFLPNLLKTVYSLIYWDCLE